MLSTIKVDISLDRQEKILIKWVASDDPRDKLIIMLLQSACPDRIINDGFARVSIIGKTQDGCISAEVVPVTPLDMLKYIDVINLNAERFIPQNLSQEPA